MNKFYQKIRKSNDYSKILENFISLSLIRVADFILPLIALPYIISVIGVDKFGLIAFVTSVVTYFLNITQYGFSLSAVRDLSINQNNPKKTEDIFNSVFTTKLYLFIFSFFVIILLIFSVSSFYENQLLYFLATGLILGDVLFPKWFFQGIEQMRYITIINTLVKLVYVFLIFVFVKEKSDYILVLFFQSITAVIAGFYSLYIIFYKHKIKIRIASFINVKQQFNYSFSSCVTLITPTLYSNTSIFLLGIFTSSTVVGYFSGAIRITNAFSSLNTILTRTFYPFVNKTKNSIKKINMLILIFGLFTTIFMFISASFTVENILGNTMINSIPLVMILSLSPLLLSIRTVYGINYLLANKLDNLYMRIALFSSIFGLIIGLILIPIFGATAAALVIITSQLLYASLSYIFHIKKKRLYGI